MASWKKVIVSGSQAELAGITGSLLNDGYLLSAENGGAITSTGIQISNGDLVGDLTGSVNGNADTATALAAGVTLQISGDAAGSATGFDGSANADISIALASGSVGHGQLEADSVKTDRIENAAVTNAKIATPDIRFSGSGISTDASVALGATASISVNADDVTIEVANDVVQLKSGSISVGHLDSDLLVIESEGIASNDNDNTIATVAAIKDYVDQQVGGATLNVSGSDGTNDAIDLNDEDLTITGSGVVDAVVTANTVTLDVKDGSIGFAHLADGAASGSAIADGGIGNAKLVDGTIANAKLVNDSVHISGSGINAASVALGATASISLNVDDTTIEIDGDNLQVKDRGIDTDQLANDAVETAKIADGNVTNDKLANDGLMIGNTDISLGATGSTVDGLTLTAAEGSGSFSGSFQGDGSNLTGIATTLNVSSSDAGISVDLKTEDLSIIGTANEVTTSVSGQTVTVGLPTNVTIQGDLTVLGTRTELNVEDLVVEDRFIYLASGSAGATDGGIIVEGAGDADGAGFGWDQSEGRWGFENTMASGSDTITPTGYAAAVVTSDLAAYQKVGNIRIDTSTEDIYIYS